MTDNTTNTFDFNALIEGVQCTHKVRVATVKGDPWFVATDVCKVLFPKFSPSSGVSAWLVGLDPDQRQSAGTLGISLGSISIVLISESGLYDLILRAHKTPQAKPFRAWVTREVLPSIRKTGGYQLGAGETMHLPASFTDALRQHAATLIKLAEEQEEHARTKAQVEAAQAAKAQAEAELSRVAPMVAMVGKHDHTLSAVVRTLDGVHLNRVRGD